MYRVLWRINHGEADLLGDDTDDRIRPLVQVQRDVRRDSHKMTAFVRFRELDPGNEGPSQWIAWFEPAHRTLKRMAPFFVKRFATMVWTIATPDGVAAWDRAALRFLPADPATRPPAVEAGIDGERVYVTDAVKHFSFEPRGKRRKAAPTRSKPAP